MSERVYDGPWRRKGTETEDYPGLFVDEQVVTGSIRCGGRLPLWAFMGLAVTYGWDAEVAGYYPEDYGWDREKAGTFIYNLLEQRGEFGRLVCILADTERRDTINRSWWETKTQRRRVVAQLRRCIAALDELEPAP